MIKQLESLRGIAALTVVLYHYSFTVQNLITNNFFVSNGYIMVDFFFVLSGYIISLSAFQNLNTAIDLKNFIYRRFLRVYPLHLLFLILYSLLEIFVYFFEIKTGISRNYHLPNNIESFIHNLILTNGFLLNVETFNSPSWSISVEFYCYIFFSLIVLFFKKYYKIFALLIIFVSFLFLYNYSRIESLRFERITSGYIALFRCLYSFFIGSIFFFIFKKYNLTIYKFYSIFFSILIVLIFFQKYQLNILSPLIFVLIIFFAQYSNSNNFFQKLLVNKTLVFVGTISYSIYISHYIILWILRQFYRFVYKAEYINPKLNYSFILDGFESYFFIFLGIGVTILASVLLNSFIESKFMYFSNKNFKKL